MDTESRADTRVGTPAVPLRGMVAYQGYDLRGSDPGRHRGLPSPYLTLVVTFDEPLHLQGRHGGRTRHDAVLGGLHDETTMIVHDGRQSGVHVVLDPLAARALLGCPASALAGQTLDVADVLGGVGGELHERVEAADGWAARFAALDDVLAGRLLRGSSGPGAASAEVRHAWRRLVGGDGVGVRAVAREVGWSDRHLGQRFRSELGVPPKVAARMARFDRARRVIAARAGAGVPLGLADVAAGGGFADQAHLSREFRALAGCSPRRWVAEEIGNLQDAPPPEAPRSTP